MTSVASFTRKSLTASEYILALFAPTDNVAILVRNRRLGQTLQRITKAELIAAPEFQSVLLEQNQAGADIFVGMNPIKDGAYSRINGTKEELASADSIRSRCSRPLLFTTAKMYDVSIQENKNNSKIGVESHCEY